MLKLKRLLSASVLVLIYILFAQSAWASTVDKIVAFGDSLTDNGNIYSLTKKTRKALPFIPIIPKNPPYFEGRFTNGHNWVENLAVAMDIPLVNYAYGGSWAEPFRDSGLVFPFSLSTQVDMYMVAHVADYHQGDHLFTIWSGANDYIIDRADIEYATDNTISNIKKQIDWLIYYGGKHFLIPNLPDISHAPKIQAEGPDEVHSAREVVKLHNKKMKEMIAQIKEENPEVEIIFVDVTGFMDDVIANPGKYHLKNVKDACYKGGYWLQGLKVDPRELEAAKKANIDFDRSPGLRTAYLTGLAADNGELPCKNPDEYLFWDELHPTRAVHQISAEVALKALQEAGVFGKAS